MTNWLLLLLLFLITSKMILCVWSSLQMMMIRNRSRMDAPFRTSCSSFIFCFCYMLVITRPSQSLIVTWNNTEGLLWMTTVFLLLLFPRYGHHNLIFCAHCLVSRGMRGHRTVSPGPPLNVVAVGYVLLKVSWNEMATTTRRESAKWSQVAAATE